MEDYNWHYDDFDVFEDEHRDVEELWNNYSKGGARRQHLRSVMASYRAHVNAEGEDEEWDIAPPGSPS